MNDLRLVRGWWLQDAAVVDCDSDDSSSVNRRLNSISERDRTAVTAAVSTSTD